MEELKNSADVAPAHFGQSVGSKRFQRNIFEADATGIWSVHAAEAIEQRGFAAAGSSGQREAFAVAYGQHTPRSTARSA